MFILIEPSLLLMGVISSHLLCWLAEQSCSQQGVNGALFFLCFFMTFDFCWNKIAWSFSNSHFGLIINVSIVKGGGISLRNHHPFYSKQKKYFCFMSALLLLLFLHLLKSGQVQGSLELFIASNSQVSL